MTTRSVLIRGASSWQICARRERCAPLCRRAIGVVARSCAGLLQLLPVEVEVAVSFIK